MQVRSGILNPDTGQNNEWVEVVKLLGSGGSSTVTDASAEASLLTIVSNTTGLATQVTLANVLTALGSTGVLSTEATSAAILTAINNLISADSGLATQVTLANVLTALGSTGLLTKEATALNILNGINSLVTAANNTLASQTTSAAILTATQALTKPADNQLVNQAAKMFTPTIQRVVTASGGSFLTPGLASAAFFNSGTADITVLNTVLHPGDSVSFVAQTNGTLGSFSYNSFGSEVLITTTG